MAAASHAADGSDTAIGYRPGSTFGAPFNASDIEKAFGTAVKLGPVRGMGATPGQDSGFSFEGLANFIAWQGKYRFGNDAGGAAFARTTLLRAEYHF